MHIKISFYLIYCCEPTFDVFSSIKWFNMVNIFLIVEISLGEPVLPLVNREVESW